MNIDLERTFRESLSSGLKSQTLSKCSRWAQHRRIMGSPFPGPYSFEHHPWCRDIHDSRASFNTAMKSAQMGLTEIAINRAFYTVDILKKDVLYVLPTSLNASDFAKARFNTALSYSEYLKELFTDTNTVGLKQAGGVNLYIRGSRGDSNLKSIPVSTLILDELDAMEQKQVWLALERLSGHVEKLVWAISTPTIPRYGIHKLFLQGTQEHYYFRCPHCNKLTELLYPECIEIVGEALTDPRCKNSYIKCKECGHKLDHESKPEWLADGIWKPTVDVEEDHRSFYINQLYSYTVSPGEIAIAHFRGLGDEAAQVEFHNSKIGVSYIPDKGQVTDEEIDDVIRGHTKNDPRPKVGGERCIVMGADQGKTNHIVILEFFVDRYDYDVNAAAYAKLLYEGELPGDNWKELDRKMSEFQVLMAVCDADPNVNDARRFARRFPGYVHLCRYRAGQKGKELQVSEEEGGAPIVTVDRTSWIDAALGRFHSQRIALPIDVSLKFREQAKNLIRTYEKDKQGNPQAVYLSTGADHFGHALTYAEIALPLAASIVTNKNIDKFL